MEKKPREMTASHGSTRWLIRLALLLAIVSLALTAAGLVLLYVTRAMSTYHGSGFRGDLAIFSVLSSVIGVAVSSRHLHNPIGWLFSAMGVEWGLTVFANEYAVYALISRPGTAGGMAAAWLRLWVVYPVLGLVFPLALLLFPNGRLLSRRWRHVFWLVIAIGAFTTITRALLPGPLRGFGAVENPLGVREAEEILKLLEGVGFVGIQVGILIPASSLLLRLRQARGEERQQIKWFVYAGTLAALAFAQMAVASALTLLGPTKEALRAYRDITEVVAIPAFGSLYVAAGIGMLKYRLYDIDLVINRTLVYVPLTALLAGVYIAVIGIFKTLLTEFTGKGSDAAVALTTILVVALLTPLKNSVQTVVDRYFKEAREPSKQMALLQREVQSVVLVLDMKQLVQRLLDTTIAAFDAEGGSIHLDMNGVQQLAYSRGSWDGAQQTSIPLEHGGRGMGAMVLGPRSGGGGYSERERDAIRACAGAVAKALTLREGGPPSQGS